MGNTAAATETARTNWINACQAADQAHTTHRQARINRAWGFNTAALITCVLLVATTATLVIGALISL